MGFRPIRLFLASKSPQIVYNLAMGTFISFSFGCRLNQAEKEALDAKLLSSGWQINQTSPEVIIINTCAVTAKAEREARQLIYQLKRKFPEARLVITGCAATYWQKNRLYSNLPIDLAVVNKNKEKLVKTLISSAPRQSNTDLVGLYEDVADKFLRSGRLLVKIQDGCHRFCSYCIVPYLRGLPRSYHVNDIVSQINRIQPSPREVILTAINTESYGQDTKEKLTNLIKEILKETAIPRISFGSIHPLSLTDNFLKLYQKNLTHGRLVNFFHVPIQSGSNKILDLMKRGYQKEEINERVNKLARINSQALIATDIIVGFLGETDKDFAETYDFLKKSLISKFHLFKFSIRNNTAAFHLAKRLPQSSPKTKLERSRALSRLGLEKYQRFLRRQVGRNSTVLFLEKKEGEYQEGLLDNQVPVLVKTDKNRLGTISNVRIIEFKNGRLFAKIV